MKSSCKDCANKVGEDHCTMFKDMNKAKYSQCDGYKLYTPAPIKSSELFDRMREIKRKQVRVLKDDKFSGSFMQFVTRGGHYSFRTGELMGETK